MKKLGISHIIAISLVTMIICTINCNAAEAPTISQDGNNPIIILPFEEGTEIALAVYQDFQDSFVYDPEVEVQDPDGITVVIFMYRPLGNDSWHSIVGSLIEGTDTNGTYRGAFSWFETGVEFKVSATDSLGYTTISGSIFYLIDPFAIHPGIMFVAALPIIVIAALWLRRSRS